MALTQYTQQLRDRLDEVCAVSANAALARVKGLLDTGRLLLVTARRFDRDSKTRANCLDGAKRCQLRVEEDLWKFQGPESSQLTTAINRLRGEISALL